MGIADIASGVFDKAGSLLGGIGSFAGKYKTSGFRSIINGILDTTQIFGLNAGRAEAAEDAIAALTAGDGAGVAGAAADGLVSELGHRTVDWFVDGIKGFLDNTIGKIPLIGGILSAILGFVLGTLPGLVFRAGVSFLGERAQDAVEDMVRGTGEAAKDAAPTLTAANAAEKISKGEKVVAGTTAATATVAANTNHAEAPIVSQATTAEKTSESLLAKAPSVPTDIKDGLRDVGKMVDLETKTAPVTEALAINTLRSKAVGGIAEVASHSTPVLNDGVKIAKAVAEVVA